MPDPRGDALRELVPEPLRQLEAYEVPRPASIRAKLDANESPFALPPEVARELAAELAAIDLNRYPRADCAELRRAVGASLGLDPASLVFGNGSDELIAFLIAAFSRPRPGAARPSVLYPVPSFVVYRLAALAGGADPVEVPLTAEFDLDAGAVDQALAQHRPNLAFFALPNNPTGTLWSYDEILRIARAYPDMLVVSDEAYADYGCDTLVRHIAELPNLVVMRTLSKIGLAALRVGFLSASPAVVSELEKVRHPYNLGTLNQHAAAWLLRNHGELLRSRCLEVVREREALAAELARLPGVRVFPSRANLLLVRIGAPGDGRAAEVWRQLADRGVLVRNFDRPGPLSGCLRITVGTADENRLLLDELRAVLA
jgi:histidinol-phosphate aminotransferase